MMADWADGARARFVFFEFSVFAAAQKRAADVDLVQHFDIPVSLTSADGSSFTFLACMDTIGAHFRVHVAVATIVCAGGAILVPGICLADPLVSARAQRTGNIPKTSAEMQEALSKFTRTAFAPILVIYKRQESGMV